MKKFICLIILGTAFTACSKEKSRNQESNVMLQEPAVSKTDSSEIAKPADQTMVETSDSAAATIDSTAATQ